MEWSAVCILPMLMSVGPLLGVRLEDGTELPLNGSISDYLIDQSHVFVMQENLCIYTRIHGE